MTPEQEAAVAELDKSRARYERTDRAHEESSRLAREDALAALRIGVRPAEVERHSPFTGSYLRRIARENGIEGDARYDRTK